MADDRTLEQRLTELESRVEVAELIANYCEGVDRRDIDTFMAIWHEGAESIIPGGRGEFRGLEEIRASQATIATFWNATFHWTMNHTMAFDSENAMSGESNVFAICERQDGTICLVGGTYWDTYVRRDGDLRFTRRLTQRHFVSPPLAIPLLPPA